MGVTIDVIVTCGCMAQMKIEMKEFDEIKRAPNDSEELHDLECVHMNRMAEKHRGNSSSYVFQCPKCKSMINVSFNVYYDDTSSGIRFRR